MAGDQEPAANPRSIDRLKLKNFTVFNEADFQFSTGLNVIVGENGTGKTHILKLAYSLVHTCNRPQTPVADDTPTKAHLQKSVAEKLVGVFRPDELGRLVRRKQGKGRCEVSCEFSATNHLELSFNSTSKKEVVVDETLSNWLEKLPVFLPTRELLSISPGFVSLYDNSHIPFEETYRDTCSLLGFPLARGPREAGIKKLLEPIEEAMHGKVEADANGRFYLNESNGAKVEIHLVAEGLRKLAMLARLIATGQLEEQGYLFWDEPEANLNSKVIKTLARTMLYLCQNGIQLFVATHSLFLMRELDILLQTAEFGDTGRKFFGLQLGPDGVTVEQGESVDDIGDITSLQEELVQTDRYLQTEVGNGNA